MQRSELALLEQGQDRLWRPVRDRKRLRAKLLLHLKRLQAGRRRFKVRIHK